MSPRSSRSRRTLDSLLQIADLSQDVVSVELLDIGWAGRRGRGVGTYRDDDGTHSRVTLGDGSRVVYREYANTTWSSAQARDKEAFVFGQLAGAGLPTPDVMAAVDGTPGRGGDPAAMLLSDRGGSPLEVVARTIPPSRRAAVWSTVGATLSRLHHVDVAAVGHLGDPDYGMPWTKFIPYLAKSLRQVGRRRPDLAGAIGEVLVLLRKPVVAYLEDRPRAICCGHISLPGMMLERDGDAWRCRSWLSLGYYVSVGDPDRDVVAIAALCRQVSGADVPDAFYRSYGRKPDPVCELLYGAMTGEAWLESLPSLAGQLRERLE